MLQYRVGVVLPNMVMPWLTSEIYWHNSYIYAHKQYTGPVSFHHAILCILPHMFHFKSSQFIPLSRRFPIRGEKRLLALSCLSLYITASLTGWIFVQFDRGLV